jgi:hypothetical protein
MYGAALGLEKRGKTAEKHADGWMNRALNAEKRLSQAEIQLKVEICSHARAVAQNEALKKVIRGEIARESLNKVVGIRADGSNKTEIGLEDPESDL